MPVPYVPEGKNNVIPYLIVPGVARLLQFLQDAFGAEELDRTTLPDGRIMHAEVRIGGSTVMLGEPQERWTPMPASVVLYVPDTDATYRRALAAGGESLMEPADQFYGDRMAGVKDPSGNYWWIATHLEDVSPEEIERRAAEVARTRAGNAG